jgi:hypothetical protein
MASGSTASAGTEPKKALTHPNMKVKVMGERVVILLDMSREEYVCFQVPCMAEDATTTTARP